MKKAIGPDGKGKAAEQLGLKELMLRLKRCVENTKSQILREHALGTIASILRHRGKANPFKVPYSLTSLVANLVAFFSFRGTAARPAATACASLHEQWSFEFA